MRVGKPYDVVILGTGLSGLLAAALLARRGRHVLVLEEEDTPGGLSCQTIRNKFTFLRGPALFLGFERDGLYDRLFMELGLSLTSLKREGTLFQTPYPAFQLVLPNHRMNFYQDPAGLFEELTREFPDNRIQIQSFFMEVDRQNETLFRLLRWAEHRTVIGFREKILEARESIKKWIGIRRFRKRSAKEALALFGLDRELYRGIELLLLLFTGMNAQDASELDLLLLLGLIRRQVVTISGGIPKLCELLIGVIHKYQGDVLCSQPISGLVIERKRVTAVRMGKADIPLKGDCIVNLPAMQLPGIQNGDRALSFHYGVAANVLPSPMKEHVVMCRRLEKPPTEDNFLFLILSRTKEEWAAPEGQRALQVILVLKQSEKMNEEDIARVRKSVESQLLELIPFSKQGLTFLGYELSSSDSQTRLSGIDAGIFSRAKMRGYSSPGYFTLPLQNLFLLPDEGHRSAIQLWQGMSAMELANHLMKTRAR